MDCGNYGSEWVLENLSAFTLLAEIPVKFHHMEGKEGKSGRLCNDIKTKIGLKLDQKREGNPSLGGKLAALVVRYKGLS